MLAGDFNARTGLEPDFIVNDNILHIPIDNTNYNFDCITEERVSQDSVVDSRGKDLLELCICNQLRILNGRCFGNSTGKHTCFKPNGCSVVDYVLVSESLLQNILYMFVSDLKPIYSDCHCKISIKILASFEYQKETSGLKDFPTRYIWNAESINCFQETFAHPAVQNEIKAVSN